MVPPKLTVVPHREESEHEPVDDSAEAGSHDARSEEVAGERPAPTPEVRRGLPPNIAQLPSADRREQLRILEALLFAAAEPLAEPYLATHLKSNDDVSALLEELKGFYASRGINLTKVSGKWRSSR